MGLLAAAAFASCTEDTGTLGIIPTEDVVSTSKATFWGSTRSTAMGPIVANNSNAYLGNVLDPETGTLISASYAAQFHCFENYSLPKKENMVGDIVIDPASGDTTSIEYGVVKCDSCEVRIYMNSYYGDGNNPMKLEVFELDEKKIMEETDTYQSNTDLTQYAKLDAPIATKVFTPRDYILTDAELDKDDHTDNIRVMLPKAFGQRILEKYYEDKKNYQDSYHFIRNVFPGFYFRISNGEGTMMTTRVSVLNVYYDFADKENPKNIYSGIARFSATPEVLQSTCITNGDMSQLINETGHTYLKTPAGICTEMTLPIDDIFDGHPTDSVSMAQVTIARYNNEVEDKYQLGTPTSLLMVRKGNFKEFFNKKNSADGRTNYVCTFSSTYNSYTFNNIARLLAYCKNEKKEGAQKEGITEAEWEARHPDWNKVLLVPVAVTTNSNGVLTSVSHEMQMSSAKLVGGKDKIGIQVIYSKYNKH